MRLIIVLGMFFGLNSISFGQAMHLKNIESRVDFREPQNSPARKMPQLLLQAFCAGEITGYYPNSPTTPMDYTDFLYHFGMPEPLVLVDSDTAFIPCAQGSCFQLDPYFLQCFTFYMDLIEMEKIDKIKSVKVREIDYLKLVFSAECSPTQFDYSGPLFKLSDIKKLTNYAVPNPENAAANLTFYDYLVLRSFSSTVYKVNGEYADKPALEEKKQTEKMTEQESGLWDY